MSDKVKASYHLSAPVAKAVRLLAAKEGRSQSEFAEAALRAYLAEHRELLDWLAAAEPAFRFWEHPMDTVYDSAAKHEGGTKLLVSDQKPLERSSGLAELARRGLARLGAPNDASLYPSLPRLVPEGTVARLLDEERGER